MQGGGGGWQWAGAIVREGLSRTALLKAAAQALVAPAHEVCPYSNATRGNIDVTLAVV